MNGAIDLRSTGPCDICEHPVTDHRAETFTNRQTNQPVPAHTCVQPKCFCFRKVEQ